MAKVLSIWSEENHPMLNCILFMQRNVQIFLIIIHLNIPTVLLSLVWDLLKWTGERILPSRLSPIILEIFPKSEKNILVLVSTEEQYFDYMFIQIEFSSFLGIDLERMLPDLSNFYTYQGSLTTPPLNEVISFKREYQIVSIIDF